MFSYGSLQMSHGVSVHHTLFSHPLFRPENAFPLVLGMAPALVCGFLCCLPGLSALQGPEVQSRKAAWTAKGICPKLSRFIFLSFITTAC